MTIHAGLPEHAEWYDGLQANILKPNGRDHHALILLSFLGSSLSGQGRLWIRSLPVSSFGHQLREAELYRAGQETATSIGFMLSATGYAALGASVTIPSDPAFRQGMRASAAALGDPSAATWPDPFRHRIDAILTLADDREDRLSKTIAEFTKDAELHLGDGAVLGVERGTVMRDADGLSHEPFGFRDSLSNPLFMASDIEKAQQAGDTAFDARAGIEIALVPDPNIPNALGSYVVVRKLEQNVRAFRRAELELAAELQLSLDDERPGAMIVGRFRDGTPLSLSSKPGSGAVNNFNYAGDRSGAKCPLHAHIRKVNDRGESLRSGASPGDELQRRIVRRGFSYRDGSVSPTYTPVHVTANLDDLPDRGVGTLFVAFQGSIRDQFERLMSAFINNPDYISAHVGSDALVGVRKALDQGRHWPRAWNGSDGTVDAALPLFVTPKGGEYFFAPSLPFIKSLPEAVGNTVSPNPRPSTERTRRLRQELIALAFSNRKDEWFTPSMLPNILIRNPEFEHLSVIRRQALACRAMMQAMTNPENSESTRTYSIRPGELLVGTIPMGSLGLGKTFPGYLTNDEKRAASLTNRDEISTFGHTVPNFRRVLGIGLSGVVSECKAGLLRTNSLEQKDFYLAVIESCEAVVEFSEAFASLADRLATEESDAARSDELLEIARVCRAVPAGPAGTFREALQAIWTVHLAQTSFCVFNSLGRLDQVLDPYLRVDLEGGIISEGEAVELLECFLIKASERINLNPTALRDQDHLTFGTGIGTQAIYLDQVASCNNFIQNIVLGGVARDGSDATTTTTLLFLQALSGVGLPTPTINVRLHKDSPAALLDAVDSAFRSASNGHPILYNDESIVPGLVDAGIPLEEARDFAIAGCWEPMLQGKNSFMFGMVNMLRVVECSINQGTLLSADAQFLIGQKQSWQSPTPDSYETFDQLMTEVRRHMQFFADKVALGTCTFFMFPSAITPTPFLSALLDGCIERGVDQSLGGADYNIVANLAYGVPNAANALANIKRYVFEERRWKLSDVVRALRNNWGLVGARSEYEDSMLSDAALRDQFAEMRRVFLESDAKFGNNLAFVDEIAGDLLTSWYLACKESEVLVRKAFLAQGDSQQAQTLRQMANYPGARLNEVMRSGFDLYFTSGSGTFGQYSSMGKGVSASADGRLANESLAPNCSPVAGTALNGLPALFSSLKSLRLERFGCAVVTDIRIDGTRQPGHFFADLASDWVAAGGSMMTVSVLSTIEIAEMIRVTERVRSAPDQIESLRPYADRFCRVGGWNSPFICLPKPQQRDHLFRSKW
jgi:Dyp-type peroxidase family